MAKNKVTKIWLWQAAKPSGKDEAVDYNWLMEFKKTYSASKPVEQQSFISLSLEEETPKQSYPNKDSHINVMGKTYTLEDGEGLMAELK